MKEAFLALVRLGIGNAATEKLLDSIDWNAIEALAKQHGLLGVLVDGIQKLPQNYRPPQLMKLRWIGEVQLEEVRYNQQWCEACKMAQLFHQHGIRTFVLKGNVVSECYPMPQHRVSSDVDCFLLPEEDDFDAWDKGNHLIEETGGDVEMVFYKNCTFHFSGLTVENHRYLVPFRGNKRLQRFELYLQGELKESSISSKGSSCSRFEGSELWRPPVMVSALFLIEHAYSHFLHKGLTWRHVLDWVMFSLKHKDEIDWKEFDARIDEFGFRKFYNAFSRLGQYLIGEFKDFEGLSVQDKRMLEDIWAPLDVHETVRGLKGKLALVGNTWRARWKYHYFTDITWFTALWNQVKGLVFEKNPTLY